MGASSTTLHESPEALPPETVDRHRVIVSIMEELEAVDWYDQRVHAASDPALAQILAHNRDEEKEHAMMALEWLRRHDPVIDRHMKTYLFTEAPIVGIEKAEKAGNGNGGGAQGVARADSGPVADDGSLGIGSLRAQVTS